MNISSFSGSPGNITPIPSQEATSSSIPAAEPILQQDLTTEESQVLPGSLLRGDYTGSSVTVNDPPSPIPASISSVLSSSSSSSSAERLRSSSSLSGHLSPLPSNSEASSISNKLSPHIPGNKLSRDLKELFNSIKSNLSKKEDVEKILQARNEAFIQICREDPELGAELEEISQIIKEKENEIREIRLRLPVKQAVKSTYKREIQSVDSDDLSKHIQEDSKALVFNEETLALIRKKKAEYLAAISALREKMKTDPASHDDDQIKMNEIKEETKKLTDKEKKFVANVNALRERIEVRNAILDHGQRYANDGVKIQEMQDQFDKLVAKALKGKSFLSRSSTKKRERKSLALEISNLKASQKSHLGAIADYQGVLETRILQREEVAALIQEIEIKQSEINSQISVLENLELEKARQVKPDSVSFAELRYQRAICNREILAAADEMEKFSSWVEALPPDMKQQMIHDLAQEFINIGKWPPRPSNPFSELRTAIVQEMVNIALSRRPPEYFGETGIVGTVATTGIYIIRVDVDVPQPNGTIEKETRILGGFKPNDEAPGGRFALKPLEEVQPGLPSETADIRQNLVSKLGGAGTMDSVLVTAQHPHFNYRPAGSEIAVEPTPKEGILIEWMTAIPGPRPNLIEFIHTEKLDNEIYSRIYEDIAFANWDPNEGNQLISKSSEGRLGLLYSWKQFDLDKAFPAGFVSMSNDPVWIQSPLANQPMPLALKERIRTRDVEKEIEQASHFWNKEIDRKQARINQSDATPEDKEARITALETCRWSEAHANVLRARDTLLKVAVDLDATPLEIFEMTKEITMEYKYSFNLTQLREFLGVRRIEFPSGLIRELTTDLHSFFLNKEEQQPLDLPNRLAAEYIVAKAKAILIVDTKLQDTRGLTLEERKQEVIKLTQEFLVKQLQTQIEFLRSQRTSQLSTSSSSSSSSSPSSSSSQLPNPPS